MEVATGLPRGVMMQAYLDAFDYNGLPGLVERIEWLTEMGFQGLVTQPVNLFRKTSFDGPYSPLSHSQVDDHFGGLDAVVRANQALREAGISPVGDLVVNHFDELSEQVQRAIHNPKRWGRWFRLSNDREVWKYNWADKVNIFGLDHSLPEPMLESMMRQATFYPDQWDVNIAEEEVVEYFLTVTDIMLDEWGYLGLRLDAMAYLAGVVLETLTGHLEPAGMRFVERLKARLVERYAGQACQPFLLAEAGGPLREIQACLLAGRCDTAYDFEYAPTFVHGIDRGDWIPYRRYRAMLREVAGRLLRFLGSHDEWQLRYSYYKEPLIEAHGGPSGEWVCFGGNGISVPRRHVFPSDPETGEPSDAAWILFWAFTILSDGVPLIYQTDVGGWGGDLTAHAYDVRDPNRCGMPWTNELPMAGWPSDARYPVEPAWEERSVVQQMADPSSVMSKLRRLIGVRNRYASAQWGVQTEIPVRTPSVEVFARETEGEPTLLVVGNITDSGQTAYPDLSRWAGRRLRRLRLNAGTLPPEGPLLQWEDRTSIIGSGEHQIGVGPYAAEVLEVV
jgi:glycosidase